MDICMSVGEIQSKISSGEKVIVLNSPLIMNEQIKTKLESSDYRHDEMETQKAQVQYIDSGPSIFFKEGETPKEHLSLEAWAKSR